MSEQGRPPYPAVTVTKIDRGWYVYEFRLNGIHRVGQGNRAYVEQALTRFLAAAGADGNAQAGVDHA